MPDVLKSFSNSRSGFRGIRWETLALIRGDGLRVRDEARGVCRRNNAPRVELHRVTRLLRDLIVDVRDVWPSVVVEQERHLAVVDAILIALNKGKRKRRTGVSVVFVFLPDASGPADEVPNRTSRDHKALFDWDEITAPLHELKADGRKVLPRRIATGNQAEMSASKEKLPLSPVLLRLSVPQTLPRARRPLPEWRNRLCRPRVSAARWC